MSDCGCNNTSGESASSEKEMLLVKATGRSASTCGAPQDVAAGAANCQKEDSTYDLLIADFAFPSTGSVPILVCNGALYAVGEWIQFVDNGARVQIVAINANELTVKGICSNGVSVLGNPPAGTIIRKNDAIVVIDSPECLTDEEKQEKLQSELAGATELCMPLLAQEASITAEQQVVGWTQEDDGDAGFTKCIRRVVGNFFKNGIPFFTRLTQVNFDSATHQVLILNRTTGQTFRSPIEFGLPEKNYAWGPAFNTLATLGTDQFDQTTWITLNDGDVRNFALNLNVTSINDLEITRDFYAILKINIGCAQTGAFRSSCQLKVNGVVEGSCFNNFNAFGTSSITVTVPVDKDLLSITLDLETASNINAKFFLEAKLQGVLM